MVIGWRRVEGKYGPMYFCNETDFLSAPESEVPVELRRSYENYIRTKKPENLEKKDGRYKPDWIKDDISAARKYKATYDDQWGWGVMGTELTEKQIAAIRGKEEHAGGTQQELSGSNIETALNLTNERLKDVQGLLEEMRDYLEVIAGEKAQKTIHSADKELAKQAELEDEDLGNEQ